MTKYFIRSENQSFNSWNSEYDNLHDATVAVNAIKEANMYLTDELKFHGWVTCWNGYSLEDGSKVTTSAELVKDLEF